MARGVWLRTEGGASEWVYLTGAQVSARVAKFEELIRRPGATGFRVTRADGDGYTEYSVARRIPELCEVVRVYPERVCAFGGTCSLTIGDRVVYSPPGGGNFPGVVVDTMHGQKSFAAYASVRWSVRAYVSEGVPQSQLRLAE